MSSIKNLITLLLLLSLQQFVITQIEPEEIPINSLNYSESFDLKGDKYYVINYTEEDLKKFVYITITTIGDVYNTPGFIYTSFTEKNPSANNRSYVSQSLGKNEIIIHQSKFKDYSQLYINVHTLQESHLELMVKASNGIALTLSDNKKRMKISDAQFLYFQPTEEILSKKIMIYGVGESVDYFSLSVVYYESESYTEYFPKEKFDNGYGVIMDLKELSTEGMINIQLIPNENYPGINSTEKEVEVGIEITEDGEQYIKMIDFMDHEYGYLSTNKNCYSIKSLDDSKEITLLINVYTQALTFGLYKEHEEFYNIDIFHNYYLKLSPELLNNTNYFCLRKYTPKEYEMEEFGEISYDFQLYYTEELSNIQSHIFPLVNGKIYLNSLKREEIMLYRHTAFNKHNILYSSIMTVLRGKPVLYGYYCRTYPECNMDINKFNELKNSGDIDVFTKINNHYIIKNDYAPGDQEIDGEKMSEARKQYFSLVICESEEELPNKGECQYSIEIDNQGEEIQLVPELTHANSIMLLRQNFYRIKVADYLNTTYIKIYFTILAGNADINIFSDKNHSVPVTSLFNYRHVHRKEIFEKESEILENYYLIITTEDSAFIEIKYETNFHYKGYKRLNPNEINIEFLNKEDRFTPYEVSNPDYFYPIPHPKNNDFYYTIIPLDCSVGYKYNFNDEWNVTYKHHEVSKDDISFGTSYGFELKLDNYSHTPADNKEDCAMMIYTGEKSQDIPLLIIEDMFHPSKFEETYYVYPFFMTNNFKGIIVQIQFDAESISALANLPMVVVTLKMPNQLDDYDIYTISQDTSFFIEQSKVQKYCPYAFYQCALNIELLKIDNNDLPYTILTNVHSNYESVEYVLKNKVHTYSLRPLDTRYFYTQIDKDEKGEINFMFNKGNAKVFARMVEKDNYEMYYNWNKRVRLPDASCEDLLNYDYLNNVIKYDAADRTGCNEGCELYILIESEETTKEPSYFTEVSFSIDQKWQEGENGIIEMPMNKYVKGVVDGSKYKYYTITIPYEYQKISFNLYSSYTKAYIKLGKTHFCNKENKQWEITQNEGFGRIIIDANDEKIKSDSLKGVSFSIGIKKRDDVALLGNENLFYYLEVQGLYNNPKNYYQLNSERSIICDTEDDNYCHALLYIDRKYTKEDILLYALPNTNKVEHITTYIKIYYASDIEMNPYKDSIQNLFPTEENYDQNSEEKYMFVNGDNIDKRNDIYILLTINSNSKNSLIKLISSGINASRTLLPYNTEKLIDFKENMQFYLPFDYEKLQIINYITNIKTIKGTQKLIINQTEIIQELNGNYYVEMESYPYYKSFEIDYVENQDDKDQGMFITFEKTKNDKLFSIEKSINNEVVLFGEKSFPQYVYILLEYGSNFEIELLFYDMTYNVQGGDDIFKISGVVINKQKLNQRKINPSTKIEGEVIDGTYSLSEKKGTIYLRKDKIKDDDEYYFFITVEKDSGNTNEYNLIKVKYTPSTPEDEEEEEEHHEEEKKEEEKHEEEKKEEEKKEEEKHEEEKKEEEKKEEEKKEEEKKEEETKEDEKHEEEKGKEKEEAVHDGSNAVLIISLYIVGVCLIVPLVVFICYKMKKGRNAYTINNKDVNESLGVNNDSLYPQT